MFLQVSNIMFYDDSLIFSAVAKWRHTEYVTVYWIMDLNLSHIIS